MIRRLQSAGRRVRALRAGDEGIAATEFAIVAPVLFLLLMGFFDIAHNLYAKAVIQGAVQKAGRDSSLETGLDASQQTVLDARVTQQVRALTNRNPTITRRYYKTFSDAAAAKAETWTVDTNKNGKCDAGEPFTDTNNNGVRDLDGADAGQGTADDSVLYTVTVTYPRLFPIFRFIGIGPNVTLVAKTILNNQPYGDQEAYGAATVGHCP